MADAIATIVDQQVIVEIQGAELIQSAIDTAVANLPAEFKGEKGDIGPGGSIEISGIEFIALDQFASAKPSGVTGDGTDDLPAFLALRAYMITRAINPEAGLRSAPNIYLGHKNYRLSSTFRCKGFSARWIGIGASHGNGWGRGTTINLDPGVSFVLDRADTPDNVIPFGGDGSVFEDITFVGGTGFLAHARFHFLRTSCLNSSDDGLSIVANALAAEPFKGEANCFTIQGGVFTNNAGSGIRCADDGGGSADANAGWAHGIDVVGNGRWGIEDSSFLGNTWQGHARDNILGPYTSTDVNAHANFEGMYSEGGQPRAQVSQHSLILNGTQGAGVTYNSPWIQGYFGTVGVNGLTSVRSSADYTVQTTVEVGTDVDQGIIISAQRAPHNNIVSWRFRGEDAVWGLNYGDSDISHVWTGTGTTRTFGRSAPVGNMHAFPKGLSIGSNDAPIWDVADGPPVTSGCAPGERRYNKFSNPTHNAVDFWRCTTTGAPDTWVAFP
jgi:hypothetical protein